MSASPAVFSGFLLLLFSFYTFPSYFLFRPFYLDRCARHGFKRPRGKVLDDRVFLYAKTTDIKAPSHSLNKFPPFLHISHIFPRVPEVDCLGRGRRYLTSPAPLAPQGPRALFGKEMFSVNVLFMTLREAKLEKERVNLQSRRQISVLPLWNYIYVASNKSSK